MTKKAMEMAEMAAGALNGSHVRQLRRSNRDFVERDVGLECRKSDGHGVRREATRCLQPKTPSDAPSTDPDATETLQRFCNVQIQKQQQQYR